MNTSGQGIYIGIDFGTRRIGLARSDPTGTIASALTTLEVTSANDAAAKIEAVIEEQRPYGLVIGYPLSLSGESSAKCRQVDSLIEKLAAVFAGPIHKVDERLSSVEARRVIRSHGKKVGQDKKRVDRLAAVLILQQFLDSRQ
jgi:putative Holliday junction resolvase